MRKPEFYEMLADKYPLVDSKKFIEILEEKVSKIEIGFLEDIRKKVATDLNVAVFISAFNEYLKTDNGKA